MLSFLLNILSVSLFRKRSIRIYEPSHISHFFRKETPLIFSDMPGESDEKNHLLLFMQEAGYFFPIERGFDVRDREMSACRFQII